MEHCSCLKSHTEKGNL
uniref:Uncharacterized protein n=1 Tax=Anguilla anguilla TaxID=7936 RepID=A0A0E9P6Z1_ANGAN